MSLSLGCTDWYADDIQLKGDKGRSYVIYAFGRTIKSTLITLMITGYQPRGYIEIPMDCKLSDSAIIGTFRSFLCPTREEKEDGCEGLPFYAQKSIKTIKVVRRNRFRGFDANTSRRFVMVECQSRGAIRAVARMFQKRIMKEDSRVEWVPHPVFIQGITRSGAEVLPLYEFGIDPLLRFFHDRNIKPASWIRVNKRDLKKTDEVKTNTNIVRKVHYASIHSLKEPPGEIPWVIASFDIECLSSHGSFPQPIKDWKKPARDVVEHLQTKKWTRQQLRAFLKVWCIDDIPNGPTRPKGYEIDAIFTKGDKKPTSGQIERLLDTLYPILFESNSATVQSRIYRCADALQAILEPRLQVAPDRVVQIGTSFWRYGEKEPYRHTMITLGPCSEIESTDLYTCKSESELLTCWNQVMLEEMPDILTGYNIFGFDIPYLYKRAQDEGVLEEVFSLSRFKDFVSELKEKQVKGVGGSLVTQEYIETPGMVQLDLMKIMQRDHNLDTYKLDNVASTFLRGNVKSLNVGKGYVETNSVDGLEPGNSITFRTTTGYVEETWGNPRYEVISVSSETNRIYLKGMSDKIKTVPDDLVWCMGKNDVGPQDIFRLCRGTADEQRIVAKYCVQDVVLVLHLINKLQVLTNNVAMGNVCSVPFGWIVARGQGVKIQSLVAKQCDQKGFLCPDLDKSKFGYDTFEGAIVLPPHPGMYLEEPVAVLDYASLYPSSMISVNLSHESYCDDPKWQGEDGADRLKKLGYEWEDIQYDTFTNTAKEKVKTGVKTVRFVQNPKGIIPLILENLLAARKETRTRMKYKTLIMKDGSSIDGLLKDKEGDDTIGIILKDKSKKMVPREDVASIQDTFTSFQKEVMNGQQLAYKITANSLYGQIGARTSYIYWKDIAAATTATGRKQLEIAQIYCENPKNFPQKMKDGSVKYLDNKVVYGDTDSVFVKYDCRHPDGSKMTGKDALVRSIELGCQSEEGIQKLLKAPQRLEYEKTFWPFMLFTKKRYVGDKYEFDPNKAKRTSMGIVLKRRDNAPIVKVLYGGVIDTIMSTRKTDKALNDLQRGLHNLIRGKYDMKNLVITKTLAPYYKRPETIAHKILADRIAERDPGNAPQVNERIQYAHIKIKKPKTKLKPGENIENPEYIKKHNLTIDYGHYISNQIMKPVSQIFALAPHLVSGSKLKQGWIEKTWDEYEKAGYEREEARKKAQDAAQKIIQHVIFDDVLIRVKNAEQRQSEITKWFPINGS